MQGLEVSSSALAVLTLTECSRKLWLEANPAATAWDAERDLRAVGGGACSGPASTTLHTVEELNISLWLLNLGSDISGSGISEMMLTILVAVAQFERVRIGEQIGDAGAHMRRQGCHLGGSRPSAIA
jgi:hypothetical protein